VRAVPQRTALLPVIAVIGLGAVAVALWTQHALGMEPCPWCVLQRLIFVLIAGVALAGWALAALRRPAAALVLLLALCGIAAALWQHFVAAAAEACNRTLAERIIVALGLDGSLPEIFQPRASCADAAVKLLGLPYEFWSLGLFVLIGALAWRLPALRRG
jgi:disulfide bond formation protein DsbB